jgi:hypothetical protein
VSGAVHITSGDAAAGGLRLALRLPHDAVLVHRDVLSCGPVPPIDDLAAWLAARRRFWDALLLEESADAPGVGSRDADSDLTAQLARLSAADTVTLWLGRALSDQLLLVWLVKISEAIQFDLGRLRVVQWLENPAGRAVRGMGELAPDAIPRHPAPLHLSADAIEEARRAWDAVTAPAPDDLLDLIAGRGVSATLRPALACLVDRFPDVASGLGRWDHVLLEQTKGVPWLATVLAHTLLRAFDDLDCVGDLYLAARLRRLAGGEHPLVTLSGRGSAATAILTDAGREVLAGRTSAIALIGLDDWVGGVHLQSSVGPLWFRHGATLMRSIP